MKKKLEKNKKLEKKKTPQKRSAVVPMWMACAWKRVPCGKATCKICSKTLQTHRRFHGEDAADITIILEDIGQSLKEALQMIKQDAEQIGIDIDKIETIKTPPHPNRFPFYRKTKDWRDMILEIEIEAEKTGSLWLYTETAADLFWYTNIFIAKVYRQLCNRWHLRNGEGYGNFDHIYTRHILRECTTILKSSLEELSLLQSEQKGELMLALGRLNELEGKVRKM